MNAVRFHVSVPGYLTARTLGRLTESAVFGRLSGVKMEDVPAPALPGPEWVRLRVILSGICGSDVGNLTYHSSPAMEPFSSFPAVLGHEIVAEVVEVGADASARPESGTGGGAGGGGRPLATGDRVVVDPMISCAVRGHDDDCPSCAAGFHSTCERAGDEGAVEIRGGGGQHGSGGGSDTHPLSPGLVQGYHRDLPGGWCEEIIAHRSQLFRVPDSVDDRAAVLTEPLSIGVHAALQLRPLGEGPILVIGSGPIALGTIWALRTVGFRGEIVAQTKRKHEARLARLLGASEVVTPGFEARQALVETGASAYQPLVGGEVFEGGGFPVVFDCVGNEGSLKQALRFASPRARVVLLGCAGELKKLDLTFVWARELDVKGFVGYGRESWQGERRHTFEITLDELRRTGDRVQQMVTHVFPLGQYRDGLSAAANHRRSEAVKVLLEP